VPSRRRAGGRLGPAGEAAALRFLCARGLVAVARNARTAGGEIDLVLEDRKDPGRPLVVCEVKARSGVGYGVPAEAVTLEKRRHLARAALAFAAERGLADRAIRFDVVSVMARPGQAFAVEHIPDAFRADDLGVT
jgi:putative endonuclease